MCYIENLSNAILPLSLSQDIKEAFLEWSPYRYSYENDGETCVCGKKGILHVYTIYNEITDEILYPIGSECVRKCGNKKLSDIVRIIEKHSTTLFKYGKYANNHQTFKFIYENDYQYIQWVKKYRMASYKKSVNNAFNKLLNYANTMDKMKK